MTNTLQSDADHQVEGFPRHTPETQADVAAVIEPALPAPTAVSHGNVTLPPPSKPAPGPEPSVRQAGIGTTDSGETEVSMALVPIDVPTAVEPATPPDRRWLKIVAVIIMLAVLAAVAVWGWTQYSSAADWEARAGDLDIELASTQSELVDTQASLAETQGLLSETEAQLAKVEKQSTAAEAQVEALDAQVATLANTKAQVEDERAQLSAVLATAPGVTTALRACAASNIAVSVELLDVIKGYPYRSFSGVERSLDDASVICDDAVGQANAFEATLSALGL